MLPAALLIDLTRRYQHDIGVVRDRSGTATARAWDKLPGYNRRNVPAFAETIAPILTGARDASVALSAAFYATIGEVEAPAVDPAAVGAVWDPEEPFVAHWRALAAGNQWVDAIASGRARAEAVAFDTVQSSGRRTGDAVLAESVVGWRRVLTGTSCEWCRLVSTQRYITAESADFGHGRCDCTAVPIMGTDDPGRIINRALLTEIKAGGTTPPGQ